MVFEVQRLKLILKSMLSGGIKFQISFPSGCFMKAGSPVKGGGRNIDPDDLKTVLDHLFQVRLTIHSKPTKISKVKWTRLFINFATNFTSASCLSVFCCRILQRIVKHFTMFCLNSADEQSYFPSPLSRFTCYSCYRLKILVPGMASLDMKIFG